MKLKYLFAFVAMSLGVYGVNVYLRAKDTSPAEHKLPQITFDKTPLDRSGSGHPTSYASSIAKVRPAVVSVYSTKIIKENPMGFPFNDPMFRRFFGDNAPQQGGEQKESGLGSGVIISPNGYILTNNHVVSGADSIEVQLSDGSKYPGKVIGTDPKTDIAVVKINAKDLPHAVLGDSDNLKVGDVVFAVGNPLDVGETVTMGIVSATGRSNLQLLDGGYENFIQTDASINPGNSGGALVDAEGRVIGINTAILSTSHGNIGIGFAIPINLASNVMESLINTGKVERGFLGVSIQGITPEVAQGFGLKDAKGALVNEVSKGSPADKAGLKQGDVIEGVNGHKIGNPNDLRLNISQTPPGTKVTLTVIRDGKSLELPVTLGNLAKSAFGNLGNSQLLDGVTVSPLSDDLRQKYKVGDDVNGLVVTDVSSDSKYAEFFPEGMVIEQINRHPVTSLATAQAALHPGRNMFLVNYRGVYRYISVDLGGQSGK